MKQEDDGLLSRWKLRAFRAWAIIGCCLLIGLCLYICGIIWQAVATVILASLIAFLLHGPVNRFERMGLPRWAGTTISYVIAIILIVGIVSLLVPAIANQLSVFVGNFPYYAEQWQNFGQDLYGKLGSVAQNFQAGNLFNQIGDWLKTGATTIASSLAGGVFSSVMGVGNAFLVFGMSLIVSFWILLDLPVISREVRSLVGPRFQDDLNIVSSAFSDAVYGWVKSTLICAIITGVVSGFAFWTCGIPYPAVLGFISGLLYVIPYIGPAIACIIVAIVALFVSPVAFILSIVINVVVTNVVGSIISPRLMKDSVSIHPAIILVAIMIGGALGGVIGMLAAIPTAAAIQSIFVAYYEAHTGTKLTTPDGALFHAKAQEAAPGVKKKSAHEKG